MIDLSKIQGGRDLDILVSEIVHEVYPNPKYGWYGWHPRPCAEAEEWQEVEFLPHYSTDIEEAIKILFKAKQRCESVIVESLSNGDWRCTLSCGSLQVSSTDLFMPAAICKAAVLLFYSLKPRQEVNPGATN